jgi:hypothetical protein
MFVAFGEDLIQDVLHEKRNYSIGGSEYYHAQERADEVSAVWL